MWARAQFAARAASARAIRMIGTAELTASLLALVVLRQGAVAVWGRFSTEEATEAFAASWSAWLLAAAVALDAAVRLAKVLPEAFPGLLHASPRSAIRLGPIAAIGRAALACAGLLLGVALFASLAFRDRFTLLVGDGERFEGQPGQYVTRSPPRPLSPGPKPLEFTVAGIWPRIDAAGNLTALDVRVALGDRMTSTSLWRPAWLGGNRFLRASGLGIAPRFEVTDSSGRLVDSAFVKLDIVPAGRVDHIRSEVLPHRFYVQLAPGERLPDGGVEMRGLTFQVEVVREKRLVASGLIAEGEPLAFEGFTFRIPEVRHQTWLVLVDDPGVPILALSGALACVGLVLRRRGRERGAR